MEWDRPAKVSKLVATVERKSTDNHNLRDCVQDAVREKLQEDKEEIDDIRRRSNNIIIHGLKEITGEDADARNKAEEDQLVDLLHVIHCDDVSVQSTARLAARDNSAKSRPVKVVLASEQQRDKVKKLVRQQDFRESVHTARPDHQAENKNKRTELKHRRINGENNLVINNRIVTRRQYPMQEMVV